MKPSIIHQIWLGTDPVPEQAEKTRQFAQNNNIAYTLWSWDMLVDKFGEYTFGKELPRKSLWKYIEQFYTAHLLATDPCFVVNAHIDASYKLASIKATADVYLGGSYNNPTSLILGVTSPVGAQHIKNAVLESHERSKDLLSFATEAMILPLVGNSFLQRLLLSRLVYNAVTHVFLDEQETIYPTVQAPVLAPTPIIAPKQEKVIEARTTPKEILIAQQIASTANPVETLPAFYLPKHTKRIVIITNDAENTEDYAYNHGDCIVHMNEARHAEALKYSTAASHILFVDMYPRSQMKTPADFKNFRNVVFYDKRVEKEWKTQFIQRIGKLPSLLCCLATEFRLIYPNIPVLVLGAALSQYSTPNQLQDRKFEETWMREKGCTVQVAAEQYKCMFLLLQTDTDGSGFMRQAETWVKDIPKNCLYKFASSTEFGKDNKNAIPLKKQHGDFLGANEAIAAALNWSWKYLFIGLDCIHVNVQSLLQVLDEHVLSGGHVCSTVNKLSYYLPAGLFVSRNVIENMAPKERTLNAILQQASMETHRADFLPIIAEAEQLNAVVTKEMLS